VSALLQSLTFATPAALAALVLLPLIWWLLRFTPPRPQVVRFAPLRLLLDLVNRQEQPDRTPWWLLLLRLAIAALIIIGVAHPAYAPGHLAVPGRPLVLIVDDSWAAAADWPARQKVMSDVIGSARAASATVTLVETVPRVRPAEIAATTADEAAGVAAALEPKALPPDRMAALARLEKALSKTASFRIVWLSDGLDDGKARDFAAGLTRLGSGNAEVEAIVPNGGTLPLAFTAPSLDGGRIKVTALRAPTAEPLDVEALAHAANGRRIGEAKLTFAANVGKAEAFFDMPVELRNEMERMALDGQHTAAGLFLMDDRWRRKSVALQSGAAGEEAQPLLSPLYYVSRALEPYVDMSEPADPANLRQALEQGLSMLVLADIGVLPDETETAIKTWVDKGGLLLRFAGPRMAGSDPTTLVPVTLREGGRSLDSALSWETPQPMQEFAETSPFAGLAVDDRVRISRQVLAEPDAALPGKVWASLADGTPLVTAARQGKGLVVLFHVTANADWSNLPLSGLFVDMLRRVLDLAPAAGSAAAAATASAKTSADMVFNPYRALSGRGDLMEPAPETKPLGLVELEKATASAATPPGLYRRGEQERAINLQATGNALQPVTGLPAGVTVSDLVPQPALALAPFVFALAFLLFLADGLAALMLGGGFARLRRGGATTALVLLALVSFHHVDRARADDALDFAIANTLDTHLAYVITGDANVDQVSEEGLKGLSQVLNERTSLAPGTPTGVSIERDELVFFPLLYWPVLADAATPSDQALARIDSYMKNGGTILFDLRDDGAGGSAMMGGQSPSAEALRRILAKVDIPALEPVPSNHVLTRAFYLLDSFPGRYNQGTLWVERTSATSPAGNADGVSAIIIGSNDYAAAWAMDANGEPLYAVIPGVDRQREMAFRAGINIVMYALTGNYKADQVHIPDLLERLGQ
jgi:hypothetical protein